MVSRARERGRAGEVAAAVADPELPMLTLADLGILREVTETGDGRVVVTITPTYSGCPAMDAIRADLSAALRAAGYADVEIRTALTPPWTTDWIGEAGRRKLAAAGISPPGPAAPRAPGPVPVALGPVRRRPACPNCGSGETGEISRFGATACRSLWRCQACHEPFEHVKEI
ncbi:phenylacetate-CoA oxygenase subunit PaaJ [Sphaerisporangium krabiense]|uniref:Ring-1,2-phenylacetyl-CoA epoxidase subunit PaaD n=1 Tax=Sphaerisporangium krabiense TaxID=763782 RepID=A0A7W8Z6K1_9ACTN|nr:1,2-phenylacetyl-CoA epoxidase subunit PaaD [Sphaerisporangium krabiense]MBB5628322.1 ring-1,2-phenylacetyl-CoA epoxidase subunit PaaD [Sphaerisporangium krabiense]GII66319.1 phenylacetate-CoA oxygenase subunit PaaJ [Sphaerisporangium krabiense]